MTYSNAFATLGLLLSTMLFCTLATAQAPKPEPMPPTVPAAPTPAQTPTTAAPSKNAGTGIAAYYSNRFHGRPTASTERYNKDALTAANNQHPFGSRLKVTNLKNNRSVVVRVNDRMRTRSPYITDVSSRAAKQLGFLRAGTTEVQLAVMEGSKTK